MAIVKPPPPSSRPSAPERVEAVVDLFMQAIILPLSVYTGLRQGELLGLRWDDVDFEIATLQVSRQLQRLRDGSKLAFVPLKIPNSRRTIKIGRYALEASRKHRENQTEERNTLGASYEDQGLIFPSIKGTPALHLNSVLNRRCTKIRV